jgi:hypothetical protein
MWGGEVIWLFTGYFSIVEPGAAPGWILVYVTVAVGLGLVTYRLHRAELVATDEGVAVRMVMRDVEVTWGQVERFDRGLSFFGPVVEVCLRSGDRLKSLGTAAGSLVGGAESQRQLLRAIETLNRLAEERHSA